MELKLGLKPGEVIQIGNHLWSVCGYCGKLIKLTGWLRSMHLCATEAERAEIDSQQGNR
jgi:hypothetical protein